MSRAVVLGARNLGGAIAAHLHEQGWTVAAVARSDESLRGVRGRGVEGINADVADPAQLRAVLERAQALCASADVLLCIGTSLEVHPVAALPELTQAAGGDIVLITKGPTPWDGRASAKLDGDVEEELEWLVGAL